MWFAPPAASQAAGVHVTVGISRDGNLQAYVEETSGRVSASVVQTAAPKIVEGATASSGDALQKGKFDAGMSRYGLKRKANSR